MNHFSKKPDAHRRLARGSGASFRALNNRRYMAKAEFTDRQMWLDFQDAAGTALQAIYSAIMESRRKFKAWQRAFRMPAAVELPSLVQLPLPLWRSWFPLATAA